MKETKKTLVIRIDWWLGRVIAMSWAITAVASKRKVKVITSRPLVFWWNPYIVSVHWLEDRALYESVIKWNDYVELEPYKDAEFFNEWKNWLEIASKQLWLDKVYEPIMFLAEHEKLNNTLCSGCTCSKILLYQPFGSTMQWNWADKSYRSLRVQDAQYIANELIKKGYELYVIEREDQPKLEWCKQLTVQDMRWLVSLADRYPVLWVDSCMHHASKAFGKQATVIWAWTDAWRFWYTSSRNFRNNAMYEYVPFRLGIDFNTDIQNQYTNKFTKEFLDEIIALY